MTDTISLADPVVIIAGIRQFGLATDGSDLRDLEAAFERLARERDEEGYAEGVRAAADEVLDQAGMAAGDNSYREGYETGCNESALKILALLDAPERTQESARKHTDRGVPCPTCGFYVREVERQPFVFEDGSEQESEG